MSSSPLEIRIAHLEGAYERINHRLGTVETRLSNVESKIDDRFDRVDDQFHRIGGRFDDLESRLDRRISFLYGLIVISILIPLVTRFALH